MGHHCKKHDKHEEHGKRGKRGHRGHHGSPGPTGPTGATGPCCPCSTILAQLKTETCTENTTFQDLLCACFQVTKTGLVNLLVSLATAGSGSADSAGFVYYQLLVDGAPVPFAVAGASLGLGGLFGNSILAQILLAPGQHTVCLQWKVAGAGASACITPTDASTGTHASILVDSCDGSLIPCPPEF